MKTSSQILCLILALLAPVLIATAQPFDGERGPAAEKIDQLRHLKMIEALDLTEEQSVRLFAREKDNRKEMNALMDKRDEAIKDLAGLIKDNAGDEQLLAGINRVAAIGNQMQENRNKYLLSLQDILSVKQIAQMVVFEQQFRKEIRNLLEQLRERRKPPMRR